MTRRTRESGSLTLSLALSVAAVMAGLFFIDRYLAALEQNEVHGEARREAAEGARLMAAGNPAAAVAHYQHAHALVRMEHDYTTGYAEALLAAGDTSRAESILEDVLSRDSNDAEANLLMARAAIARGDSVDADSYYHRAIYGAWPSDAAGHQIRVRLELAESLAKRHSRSELLSELLPLRAAAGSNPGLRRKIGDLFLSAGSPGRAAAEYRSLIESNDDDIDSYKGLGEAELAAGNYHEAQRAFQHVLRKAPSDATAERRLMVASELSALDPTPRRLPSTEKYARSMRILDLAQGALESCKSAANTTVGQQLLAHSAKAKTEKIRGAVVNELAESRLSLAEELWRTSQNYCHTPTGEDDALKVIMEKLTAQ